MALTAIGEVPQWRRGSWLKQLPNRAFPDWGPLADDSATKLKRGELNVRNVYGVLFSLLWRKYVPGWPAISVSKVWGIWFVWLNVWYFTAIASRVGGGGGGEREWGTKSLHYLAQGEGQEGGCVPSPWLKRQLDSVSDFHLNLIIVTDKKCP